MDILIRQMWPNELPRVMEIYTQVHKFATPRAESDWFMLPTLVAVVHEGGEIPDFTIAGYTTMCAGIDHVFHNMETCVLPEYEGHGIGKSLFAARMKVARESGAHIVLASVEDTNPAMQHIAESHGMHACHKWYFPDGSAGRIYTSRIER
jgi:GNAT superfamily N-acetyltransferase